MERLSGWFGRQPEPEPTVWSARLSGWFGRQPEPEPTLWAELSAELNERTTLSYKHRLMGFGICLGLGFLCLLLSIMFVQTLLVSPAPFALLYSVGNVLFLASTMFLVGPVKQVKNMFSPVRLVATIIYLASLGLTLFVVFTVLSFLPSSLLLYFFHLLFSFCHLFLPLLLLSLSDRFAWW
ncbi:T-box transcription factor TBX19, variant 2 [Balamuthia mandrillaris]